jgi:hypothetical protein
MGLAGFTLADRLGAKSSPCTVAGCTRTWISMSGGKVQLGGRGAPDPADPASSMCDPCRQAFATAKDTERACERPGCSGTWTWPAMSQVEAAAAGRKPPQKLCAACEEKLAALEDKELPCAVPGCSRSAVFSKRAQLVAGAPDIEADLPALRCAPCEGVYRKLKDRPVTCGINGCKHKWTWTADEQIEAYAAGLTNDPPRRMCEDCKTTFGAIADRDVRCRTSGCKKTWTWARGDQLDGCVAGKPIPKAPHRMCESCVGIFQALKDVERPCRRSGCKGTWLDKRGAQLARAVRGKTGDPYPQYCESCEKELGDLDDRQVPCKTDNCTGTWTWTKAAQLAAGVRPAPRADADNANAQIADAELDAGTVAAGDGARDESVPVESTLTDGGGHAAVAPAMGARAAGEPGGGKAKRRNRRRRRREIRPPERRCQTCMDFLADKRTVEIPCKHCGTPIYWPPESQLQTHLGAWSEPSMCGACKRDATEAARAAQREALRSGGMIHLGAAAPGEAAASGAEPGAGGPDQTAASDELGSRGAEPTEAASESGSQSGSQSASVDTTTEAVHEAS